jgi:hypothetical protein
MAEAALMRLRAPLDLYQACERGVINLAVAFRIVCGKVTSKFAAHSGIIWSVSPGRPT